MSVDIEPLLVKLSDLAPRFGRAREDLEAMVSRGRSHDYKGVMQNARLVLEAILRSLVTEELKQTPGKAMLDELVTKFRQQANAGIVPTNILAHMGTVQAWGNLSAHDHAGSLEDSGVRVGQEEVVASLNSMVAILGWYVEKRGLKGEISAAAAASGSKNNLKPVTGTNPALQPAAVNAGGGGGSKLPMIVGGAALLAALAVGGYFMTRGPSGKTDPQNDPPKADAFAALDAVYTAWDEPTPPAACRRAEDVANLVKVVKDPDKLALIDNPSAEAAYLTARAQVDGKRKPTTLDVALKCKGFANAEHLAGMVALTENDLAAAQKRFEAARDAAPTWLDNRAKLAGVLLHVDQLDAASKEIDGLIGAKVDYAPAYLLRFALKVRRSDASGARIDLCQAVSLGSDAAKRKADEAKIECP
ncbi:MAG: hypothetical protein QM817_09495 [Archangium sp.]